MPNVMVVLPNIGGALCSTPQSLADAHYYTPRSNAAKRGNLLKLPGVPQTNETISAASGPNLPYCKDMWRRYCCLTGSFPVVDTCLSYKDIARESCAIVRRWDFLWSPYVIGGIIFLLCSFFLSIFLWSPCVIGQTIIFLPGSFFLSIYLSSSFFPGLISAAADWISTCLLYTSDAADE